MAEEEQIETKEQEIEENVEENVEEVQEVKKSKKKKAPPKRRKSKKDKESPISKAIKLAVETGKVSFGFNRSLKNIKEGKPKLVILSNNIPQEHYLDIAHFSSETNVPYYKFEGNSKELAALCGKPFLVSVLSIYEEGTSNVLKLIEKNNE